MIIEPGVTLPAYHAWPVCLRAGALVLRPLRHRDAPAWMEVRARNAEWLRPWDATVIPGSEGPPQTFGQMVRAQAKLARHGGSVPWAIAWDAGWPDHAGNASSAPLIGQVSVSGIAFGSARWAEIGYWIDRDMAGRGIVPAAVALACDYCFRVMGLHRIEIAIRPENANSLRVVEKLGFRLEGLRPRYLHIDGDWRDHLVFALHAEEAPGGLLSRFLAGRPLPQGEPQRSLPS